VLVTVGGGLPAWGDDAQDCDAEYGNLLNLLKTDPARAFAACRRLAERGVRRHPRLRCPTTRRRRPRPTCSISTPQYQFEYQRGGPAGCVYGVHGRVIEAGRALAQGDAPRPSHSRI